MIVKIFSLILEFMKFMSSTLVLLKEAEYDEPIEENAIVRSG